MPLTLFGRNTPVAALIPLTFALFGLDETQKVVFIFIACVAFVLWDTARAFEEVGGQYIDTAYTLGAGTWQIIGKVLLPLALPSVFNSLRLLFGLAFGYIMLAEVVKLGGETGGVGDLINVSQRRGQIENVILILLIIPVVALCIDRLFFFIQAELFPYRYGGTGILHRLVRGVLHAWEDFRLAIWNALSRLFGRRNAKPSPSTDAPPAPAMSSPRSKTSNRLRMADRAGRWALAGCSPAYVSPARFGNRTSCSFRTSRRRSTWGNRTSSRRFAM